MRNLYSSYYLAESGCKNSVIMKSKLTSFVETNQDISVLEASWQFTKHLISFFVQRL